MTRLYTYPSPEAKKAIEEFMKTGAWPKPGTLPVCVRLGR